LIYIRKTLFLRNLTIISVLLSQHVELVGEKVTEKFQVNDEK